MGLFLVDAEQDIKKIKQVNYVLKNYYRQQLKHLLKPNLPVKQPKEPKHLEQSQKNRY